MSFIAASVIGGVGAIAGGLFGASSASKAAKAQVQAAQLSADAQREMFNKQVQLQEPARNAGLAAQNQMLMLLGIQPQQAQGASEPQQDRFGRPVNGSANSGASIPQYNYAVDPNNPEFGSAAKAFGMDQFNADPGYAFRMSEGMKAIERSAAARGGLLSGSTLKGITRFGQDTASNEYTNAFNRYQTERQARLNPLQSLMGMGQTSSNALTGAAGSLGQGIGQAYAAQGAARASGYNNSASALNSAIGGISGATNNYMMYNMMRPSSASATGGLF